MAAPSTGTVLDTTTLASMTSTPLAASNPFAAPSTLPYQLPDFARLRTEHFRPAFDAGVEAYFADVDAISSSSDAPTFENTLVALERAGDPLMRMLWVFWALTSSDADADLRELEAELSPKIAEVFDRVHLDSALYARIRDVVDHLDDRDDLSDEDRRLATEYELEFRLAGAALDADGARRLAEINQRLAALSTEFDAKLQADTNELAVVVTDRDELAGLGDDEIAAAEQTARDRGIDGYVIALGLPTGHPWLADLANRELRERLHAASRLRGRRGNEHDTSQTVLEIVRLRAERAELLGFPNHAALVAASSMAGSVEVIRERLRTLAAPAVKNARNELALLQQLADEDGVEIAAHDWAYYAERVRARDFDLDTAAMRPYFEAERVLREGVFAAATLVYGITFADRPDLVAHNPDARVFEVFDADGSGLGLFILDLYARETKRGGAWMSTYRQQCELLDERTVTFNVLNVPKPPAGSPTLLTLDEVNTLFHEFGHALHGLLAHVVYPHFGGTNVRRDFVEYPSQVNEMWMLRPELLERYAVHHETGERLPQELVDRLLASQQFNEGFATTEYLAASTLDLAWHTLSRAEADAVTDVAEFERRALADAGLLVDEVPTRYSTCYFQHVFSGWYSAGYYGYIWSEVFDAATVEVFEACDDVREVGERFRQTILGPGGSREPAEMVREFFGGEPSIEPLLRRRGLTG